MLLSPNFTNLTVEGYTAFTLAIVFTIISLASFFYFARHKNLHTILLVVITLVMPFIAIFCWVYLLLDILKYDVFVNLGISIAAAAGYLIVAVAIALITTFVAKKKANRAEEQANEAEEEPEEPEVEVETPEAEEPEKLEEATGPMLLEHTPVEAEEEPQPKKRGRKKKTENAEAPATETEAPAEEVKAEPKKRGRKKKVVEPAEEQNAAEIEQSAEEQTTEEEVVVIPVEHEVVEEPAQESTEEAPAEEVKAEPKKRGRKKKTETNN